MPLVRVLQEQQSSETIVTSMRKTEDQPTTWPDLRNGRYATGCLPDFPPEPVEEERSPSDGSEAGDHDPGGGGLATGLQ